MIMFCVDSDNPEKTVAKGTKVGNLWRFLSRTRWVVLLVSVIALTHGVSVSSEEIAFRSGFVFDQQDQGAAIGRSVSGVGDINDDSVPDVVVGAPDQSPNGFLSGRAYVISGVDGGEIFRFDGEGKRDMFGASVSGAGDVNGDGTPDVIIGTLRGQANGSGGAGSAYVFSGADGSRLYEFRGNAGEEDFRDQFGAAVSGAGDVNNDGFDDLIVGVPTDGANGFRSGSARVFSGADGSELFGFKGDGSNHRFGGAVSGAGDVNGDGFDDVMVGGASGYVRVFSGADGSEIFKFTSQESNHGFGTAVSGLGDVNGDDIPDLIIGAYGKRDIVGEVYVLSGADGDLLYRAVGESTRERFGIAVSDAGDVNGDGVADFIVGASQSSNFGYKEGSARIFSGIDGSLLAEFSGETDVSKFGLAVSGVGDVNGDQLADVIVGSPGDETNGHGSGRATVFITTAGENGE